MWICRAWWKAWKTWRFPTLPTGPWKTPSGVSHKSTCPSTTIIYFFMLFYIIIQTGWEGGEGRARLPLAGKGERIYRRPVGRLGRLLSSCPWYVTEVPRSAFTTLQSIFCSRMTSSPPAGVDSHGFQWRTSPARRTVFSPFGRCFADGMPRNHHRTCHRLWQPPAGHDKPRPSNGGITVTITTRLLDVLSPPPYTLTLGPDTDSWRAGALHHNLGSFFAIYA